jgi:hypothetical protein
MEPTEAGSEMKALGSVVRIFVAISIPALFVALLMTVLGWLRRRQGRTK